MRNDSSNVKFKAYIRRNVNTVAVFITYEDGVGTRRPFLINAPLGVWACSAWTEIGANDVPCGETYLSPIDSPFAFNSC
jgi:hypothetical protein